MELVLTAKAIHALKVEVLYESLSISKETQALTLAQCAMEDLLKKRK